MKYKEFLLLILGGVFASALVIVIVFIIVNTCIRKKVAKYAATSTNHTKSSYEMSSHFKHNDQEDMRPPLPSRNQFDTESLTNSYEEVPENPVVADETSSIPNTVISHSPETHINFQDSNSASESYDDVDKLQNVQYSNEDSSSLPDYLEVDPPPLQNESDSGSENYDDIEQLDGNSEDYDDVG